MNLGPLTDMHPVEQAIRAEIHDDPDGGYGKAGRAVLAVLDLHKPCLRPGRKYEHDPIHYDCDHCQGLGEGGPVDYPCDTVKAIADALGVTP